MYSATFHQLFCFKNFVSLHCRIQLSLLIQHGLPAEAGGLHEGPGKWCRTCRPLASRGSSGSPLTWKYQQRVPWALLWPVALFFKDTKISLHPKEISKPFILHHMIYNMICFMLYMIIIIIIVSLPEGFILNILHDEIMVSRSPWRAQMALNPYAWAHFKRFHTRVHQKVSYDFDFMYHPKFQRSTEQMVMWLDDVA